MINWHCYRFGKGDDSSISGLWDEDEGAFECFVLEDELRRVKVMGETAIPAGRYEMELRPEGGRLNKKYYNRFDFHEGMIFLMDVPNFTGVAPHIGNDDDDTAGCPLFGDVPQVYPDGEFTVGRSTPAYVRWYKKTLAALKRHERVFWHVHDDARHITQGV